MERNKLLIADGSSLSRSVLKRIFEKDYIVLQAENGKDAFELFREHYEALAAVVIELHMLDGRTVQLQSTMDGAYTFLDHAYAAWVRQTGRSDSDCAFHDPSNSLWFPTVEEEG